MTVERAAAGAQAALDRVLLVTGYFAGAIFFAIALFIGYDVVARKWGAELGIPTTQVTDEISSYMLVLASTWGFAYTLWTDAHVRIDVLLPYLPGKLRAAADLLAYTAMAGFACLFAWRCWLLVFDSWDTGITSSTYLLTPLWIPQIILAGGFSLLALTAVVMAAAIALGAKTPGGDAAGPASIA
ncbi:MAG TPA: TRAP transporter small permease [Stellaceae bacterium]|nr:TRAP transporter small permease [Stellaceae bacterium]